MIDGKHNPAEIAVAGLEAWLNTMRGQAGYTGPVVHWWRDCLLFCGPGCDWRYEGIIAGYLTLFQRTDDVCWLDKARRAADDVVRCQSPDGGFVNSCFEFNPGGGGTPHEAAVDLGMLLLARVLRARGDSDWQGYFTTAQRNLEDFHVRQLWSDAEQRFRDDPHHASFVPNKAATLIEALCLFVELGGPEEYLHKYVRPTADAILAHQVGAQDRVLEGAIAQNAVGTTVFEQFLPYYNARCIPGLIAASGSLGDDRYVEAASKAMQFVWRTREANGAFPQVVYGHGRANRYPYWIAAAGDILRAADLLRPYGVQLPAEPTLTWLLDGQVPSGAFATAYGFAAQCSQRLTADSRDMRDLLPVCGWNDKAFRYLATKVQGPLPEATKTAAWGFDCTFKKRALELHEDQHTIWLGKPGEPLYAWTKGAAWAQVVPVACSS